MMCHPVPGPGQLLRHPPCGELLRHPPCGILLRHPPRGILLRNPHIIASWSMKDGLIPGPVDCLNPDLFFDNAATTSAKKS